MNLSDIKGLADIIQALITSLALVIGGLWSYLIFVRQRQRYPRAKIEHSVMQRAVNENAMLLSIDVIVSNPGNILLKLIKGEIEVRQVLPPEADFQRLLNDATLPVCQRVELIDWLLLFLFEEDWKKEKRVVEIEPGQSEQFQFSLLVHTDVKTIYINSFFRNEKKRRRIGWRVETFHDVLPGSTANVKEAQAEKH